MSKLEYDLTTAIGHRATLGLVVLQSDETVEPELQSSLNQEGVALYVSRIESHAEVTSETLKTMEAKLPASVALFPPSLSFDVIGYACTSGATIIGPERISQLILSPGNCKFATNPLSALIARCEDLGIKKLAYISPYIDEVSAPMRNHLENEVGIEITKFASFEEKEEEKVARIDPQSILKACLDIAKDDDCDAVFLSCTNLRTVDIIPQAKKTLGKPVLSSNSVLEWHMRKLSGL
jgi:maleate isomerase